MLRITRLPGHENDTLKLEGKLAGPWVEALRDACTSEQRIGLDLSGVTYIDSAGLELLRERLEQGAKVLASSPLVDEFLRRSVVVERSGDSLSDPGAEFDGRSCPVPPVKGEVGHIDLSKEKEHSMSESNPLPSDDQSLVASLHAGAPADFEQLVRTHAGRMLAVARRMLRSEEDANDAVQEAFLSAFRALDSFAGQSSLSTWLHRIVVNASLMKLRSRARHPETQLDELLPTFDDTQHHSRPVRAWSETATTILLRKEQCEQVRACIDRLPETHRTILLLRDIEELDTEETARALSIEPGAVKTRLHRARQALRTLLEKIID